MKDKKCFEDDIQVDITNDELDDEMIDIHDVRWRSNELEQIILSIIIGIVISFIYFILMGLYVFDWIFEIYEGDLYPFKVLSIITTFVFLGLNIVISKLSYNRFRYFSVMFLVVTTVTNIITFYGLVTMKILC